MARDLGFEAGVYQQGFEGELLVWSEHRTEAAARAAAKKYARGQQKSGPRTGGSLSWSGGYRAKGEKTSWIGPFD